MRKQKVQAIISEALNTYNIAMKQWRHIYLTHLKIET